MGVLTGKAVVVTGAGRGLGEAFAKHAAAAGARVLVNDIDEAEAQQVAKTISDAGGSAFAYGADISQWSAVEGLIAHCVERFGSLDGFVSNAALFYRALPAEENPERIRKVVEVNVVGTIFCGVLALREMQKQGRGSLVSITSGAQTGIPEMAVYGATKGAVASLTYGWAADMKGTGVRVNAISPIATTRMSDATAEYLRAKGQAHDRRAVVSPDLNAPIVTYLLSEAAAPVTGQVVRIDGKHLSLMTHPAILSPVLTCPGEAWTLETVTKAFTEHFMSRLPVTGVVEVDCKVIS